MADKATTSSLLEAIKNKLNKFDSKTPENEKPKFLPKNNSTQQDNKNSEKILDKTSISLNLDESLKKIDEKVQKTSPTTQSPNESDLDIDDESVNVKNFSPKVSVESKIKEIADEVNLEEFENDVEDTESKIAIQNLIDNKNSDNSSPITAKKDDEYAQDPIEFELMQLEKEISQKKLQTLAPHNTETNNELKSYLDSEFKKDVEDLNNQIANKNPSNEPLQANDTNSVGDLNNNGSLENLNSSSNNPVSEPAIKTVSNQNFDENINSKHDQPIQNDESQNLSSNLNNINSITNNMTSPAGVASEIIPPKLTNIFEGFNSSQNDSFNFINNFGKTFSPARDYLAKISPTSTKADSEQINNDSNISVEESPNNKANQDQQIYNKIEASNLAPKTLDPESQASKAVDKIEMIEKSTKNQPEANSLKSQNIDANLNNSESYSPDIKNLELKTEDNKSNSKISEFVDENYLKTQPVAPSNQDKILSPIEAVSSENSENYNIPIVNKSSKIDSSSGLKISQMSENINNDTQPAMSGDSDKIKINFSSTIEDTKQINEARNSIENSNLANENDKKNFIERINYNLIHEETIYQANNSIKKLVDAKNMIKSVNNFTHNDILNKIAISLMEPKLEKWLNENLPQLVEDIVKQEIDKIVPKE